MNSYIKRILGFHKYLSKNFFATRVDSLISLILLFFITTSINKLFNWITFHAKWNVISQNFNLYLTGSYPTLQQWRPLVWLLMIFILTLKTLLKPKNKMLKKYLYIAWISIIPMGIFLIGGGLILEPIPTIYWGGITLTVFITLCSGIIALPMGIVLALGRQSHMNILSRVCKLYIDVVRALPLISVLFFGQLLIPLFLPVDFELSRVMRSIISFAFFAAAYVAEDVRGGIQAIPETQVEAGEVLGLNKVQVFMLVILPQALRVSLPSLTNQAIGLLQNTSLMAILGLVELVGISRSLLANPEYIGRYMEVYVWLGLCYWLICTLMSLLAKSFETSLNRIN